MEEYTPSTNKLRNMSSLRSIIGLCPAAIGMRQEREMGSMFRNTRVNPLLRRITENGGNFGRAAVT